MKFEIGETVSVPHFRSRGVIKEICNQRCVIIVFEDLGEWCITTDCVEKILLPSPKEAAEWTIIWEQNSI